MKNLHLIPINIVDIVDRLNDRDARENERANLLLRLEAIRDYCNLAIERSSKTETKKTRYRS